MPVSIKTSSTADFRPDFHPDDHLVVASEDLTSVDDCVDGDGTIVERAPAGSHSGLPGDLDHQVVDLDAAGPAVITGGH
jgi:hypothetical protein